MVATHIFHKLEFSARLFMKKASWGCCVSVFDSSGEPAGHPDVNESCTPGCSGTEFEVGASRHVIVLSAPYYMLPWITSQV